MYQHTDYGQKKIQEQIGAVTRDIPLCWWHHIPGGLKIKECFDLTTLHGLKYFSESGRSLSERCFWIVALTLVYVGAVIVIYDQIMYFIHTPVLISIDDKPTPVWDVPFPAITICSENQVRPSYFNYSAFKGNTNMTQEQREIFEYITMTCNVLQTDTRLEFLSPEILNKVHQEIWGHCNVSFLMTWMNWNFQQPCGTGILQPFPMVAGACHTFNALPADLLYRPFVYNFLHENEQTVKSSNEGMIWSPDRGYPSQKRYDSPPWRMSGGGYGRDVSFLMALHNHDFDSNCFFGGHGFQITFHSPAELPALAHPSTYVRTDHQTMVKITPDIKVTDKILRKWTPAQRGCFFEDERFLKFFNIYTEKNCDLECEANISLSRCGCVPFYAPRTKGIPVCGPLKQPCVLESISKLLDPLSTGCNCKPSCFEINYKIDVAYYPRNWTTATTKGFKFEGVEQILENNYAHLTVQYQTQKVTAMKRIAVFGLSDFIANIGGLLGLFLGFSFLSLFEIFYFCTLRFKNKKVTFLDEECFKPIRETHLNKFDQNDRIILVDGTNKTDSQHRHNILKKLGSSKMLPTNQHQMDADSLDKPQHEISQPTLHSILCVSSEVQAVTPSPSASPSRHLAPGPHSYVEAIQGSASVSVSNVNQVSTAGSGDGVASSNIPALEICPEKKQKL